MTVGLIDLHMGNRDSAALQFADALRRSEAVGGQIGIVVAIDAIAFLAFDMNDAATAALLAVAAERLRQEIGGAPTMALVGGQPILDKVRDRNPAELARAQATAPDLSTQQAIAIAYSVTDAIAAGEMPTGEARTGQ